MEERKSGRMGEVKTETMEEEEEESGERKWKREK